MSVSGILLIVFRNLFIQNFGISDTSLRTSSYQQLTKLHQKHIFKQSDYKIDDDAYLYRANGQSDFSIVLMVQRNYIDKMFDKIYGSCIAHDVLIVPNDCNISKYLYILPRVLTTLNLTFQKESTCNISKGIPLDLVKVVTSAMGPFKEIKHINNKEINQIDIGVPETKFNSLQTVLSSINKIENIFIHGPMMYEIKSEYDFVDLSILFTAFLLVIIPHLIQCKNIDLILLILLSASYFQPYLCIFAFIYSFLYCNDCESAMIPLVGYCTFNFMIKPFQANEFVYSLGLIKFLPPFGMVLLSYKYKFLFPAAFAILLSGLRKKKLFFVNL